MMTVRPWYLFAIALGMLTAAFVFARAEAPVNASAAAQQVPRAIDNQGIPVTSTEVRNACGACHASDDEGRMSRISYRRATPENWELTIKRMVSLNHAPVTVEQARAVLKYLADNHGLAPEEARPIMFDAERRMVDFTYEGHTETHNLCNQCHTTARVLAERRTPEEWSLLIAMHRGFYPGIDGGSGGFRRGGSGARGSGGGRGGRMPMDVAIEHLQGAFPLMSTEWSAWQATRLPAQLAGRWAMAGHEPGRGAVFGEVTIAPAPDAADGFMTTTTYTYARTGERVSRTGRAIVYAGFQWRGRSEGPDSGADSWREVSFIERDQRDISGRWFTGAYNERGIDVTLRRVGRDVLITGTDISSLQTGAVGQTVRVYGANLPSALTPADIALGQGLTVTRVVSSNATMATVLVDVASTAPVGPRDVAIAGATRARAFVVYDRVDGVKVLPRASMARLGGIVHPKQHQQFEAVAFHNGPDGRPNTDDDLDLGIVDATWTLEEYSATFTEDDIAFVGEISPTGLFTPSVDGPNPERSGHRNNIGDVWVVAEFTPPGAAPLRGRAHLLVTVPLYIRWEATGMEGAQ